MLRNGSTAGHWQARTEGRLHARRITLVGAVLRRPAFCRAHSAPQGKTSPSRQQSTEAATGERKLTAKWVGETLAVAATRGGGRARGIPRPGAPRRSAEAQWSPASRVGCFRGLPTKGRVCLLTPCVRNDGHDADAQEPNFAIPSPAESTVQEQSLGHEVLPTTDQRSGRGPQSHGPLHLAAVRWHAERGRHQRRRARRFDTAAEPHIEAQVAATVASLHAAGLLVDGGPGGGPPNAP